VASGIESWAVHGKSFGQAMEGVLQSIETQMLKLALTGQNGSGGLLGAITAPMLGGLGSLIKFADGGPISGPGSGRSDSMLARVSNGEYIVNASAAAKHGDLLNALNTGRAPRFADGGAVGRPAMVTKPAQGGGGHTVHVAPVINATVNANGGTPAQNADLAAQTARHLEGTVRGIVSSEIMNAMRPGNALYR
jgi:hypothetical protein